MNDDDASELDDAGAEIRMLREQLAASEAAHAETRSKLEEAQGGTRKGMKWTVIRSSRRRGWRGGPISPTADLSLGLGGIGREFDYGFPKGKIGDVVRFNSEADAQALCDELDVRFDGSESCSTHAPERLDTMKFHVVHYSHYDGTSRVIAEYVSIEEARAALRPDEGYDKFTVHESEHIPEWVEESIARGTKKGPKPTPDSETKERLAKAKQLDDASRREVAG